MKFLRPLRLVRNWSLRRARKNVVIGERMAARVPNAVVIHNWADASLHPVDHEAKPLREEWAPGASFVAGYSGNLGRAHEFDTILAAAHALPSVTFVISGSGARLEEVRGQSGPNVSFHPHQPRERLRQSLSVPDVHLVSLRQEVEGLVVPSKFYGILAVGRPVIFIGARDGELAQIVESEHCGLVVGSGDGDGLARAIAWMAGHSGEAAAMGARGRALYERRFAPLLALAAWEGVLTEACG